ncbi:MAG: hypothetical protein FWG97_02740 [Deltaproteobacteria bacterium]|nr:hypothetical protein [Deltaproteobacteria bacterium]
MGLEHQLTARYAAGSLGGTLGRLLDSIRRLSRAHRTGSQGETGLARCPEPAAMACLNQILRLMIDAWQSRQTASPLYNQLDLQLESLKAAALGRLSGRCGRFAEFYRLALALDRLRGLGDDRAIGIVRG